VPFVAFLFFLSFAPASRSFFRSKLITGGFGEMLFARQTFAADSDLSRPGFRFEAGHRSEMNPAALWRLAAFFCGSATQVFRPFSISEEGLMPARRELTMRQLRQMLRLHHDGVSAREIGRTLGVARSTIQDNLERARTAGIGWPLPIEWTDEVLEQRLFACSGVKLGGRRRRDPTLADAILDRIIHNA